ncbi:MAG: galactokinase [Rhodothermia bacterium]|nr:galactokinase [Rhodothermia bacterium]
MRTITHEQMPLHTGLAQRGISKQEISALADGISADLAYIREMPSYNSEAIFGYFIPGRLEVLGKHTDYAGGSSLVCAVNKGFRIYGLKSDDGLLHIHHLDQKINITIDLSAHRSPASGWEVYVQTVLRRLTANFGKLSGGDLFITSDLPQAAGMSSSSAFIVALLLALTEMNQLRTHPLWISQIKTQEDLATYASCIENGMSFGTLRGERGVGTLGGSQDHVAILCSRAGCLNHFSYAPTCFKKAIALPPEFQFVIGHSGILAEKTGDALELYNRTSSLAQALVEAWNHGEGGNFPHIGALLQHPKFDLYTIWKHLLLRRKTFSDVALMDRLDHFMVETDLVEEAVKALEQDQIISFGRLSFQSQHYAERLLHNQVQETTFLVSTARRLGALAASAFGAGFGGAVWALVHTYDVPLFLQKWEATYAHTFPNRVSLSQFFPVIPGSPAFALPL